MKTLKKLLSMGLLLSLVIAIGVIASPKEVKAVSLSKFHSTVSKAEKKLKKKNKELKEVNGGTVYITKGKSKKISKHNKNLLWATEDGFDSYYSYITIGNRRTDYDEESNMNLVTVKKGKIKAVKPGVTMVMSYNKKTKILTKYKICVKGIQYKKATLAENDTFQILCTDKKGLTTGFKYTTSNKKIAKVSKKGVITAKAKGNTKIYATKGKGKNKVKYTIKVTVNEFGFYDENGEKLPVLEGGVESLYRYSDIPFYADESLLENVTAVYVVYATQPPLEELSNHLTTYKNTRNVVPNFKNIVGKISVRGTKEEVVFDYDSAANYDSRYFSSKIDKNGNITGCITTAASEQYDSDCSVSKVKVGNKYYLIEVIFNREMYEKSGDIHKKACKSHDKIWGDLTAFRKENDIVWYY